MASSVIYYSTKAPKNEIYLFYTIKSLNNIYEITRKKNKNILLKYITPSDDVVYARVL